MIEDGPVAIAAAGAENEAVIGEGTAGRVRLSPVLVLRYDRRLQHRCRRQLRRLRLAHHRSQSRGSIMVKRSTRRIRISTSRTSLAEGIAYGVSRGLQGLRFPSTLPRASSCRMMEGRETSLRRYHRSMLITLIMALRNII